MIEQLNEVIAGRVKEVLQFHLKGTPEEFEAWRKTDYWNRGDYNPLVMFVVIPSIIQLSCLAMMGGVMYIAGVFFN